MFKYIKRLFGKRNNAGFTLVEVVVSIALLGIMLIGVLGFTAPLLANVAEKQQDAQAVMLMEAVDSYITNSLRNAKFLKIIANVNMNDTAFLGTPEWAAADNDIREMAKAAAASGGEDELHCISFRWRPTGGLGERKLVLMQETVTCQTNGSYTLSATPTEVMGDAIYNKMYIVPQFEMISSNPANPGDPKTHNIGIANVTRVYKNGDCYSTSYSNRRASSFAYEGQSFNALTVISSQFVNRYDNGYKYKAYDLFDAFTYNANGVQIGGYSTAGAASEIWTDDAGNEYYYPETYIFYVARNLGVTTTP